MGSANSISSSSRIEVKPKEAHILANSLLPEPTRQTTTYTGNASTSIPVNTLISRTYMMKLEPHQDAVSKELGDVKLVRLTYISRPTRKFESKFQLQKNLISTESDLDDILRVAQANNARDGISGTLFATSNLFLQTIEGQETK